jgi:hypothetical protein
LRPAAEFLQFHSGELTEGLGCCPPDIDKTGDALPATPTVAELALEAIQLNSFPEGNIPKVFPRVTLHVTPFTQKTNHWHGASRNMAIF